MRMTPEELRQVMADTVDALAEEAEHWQGDSLTHETARAIIGQLRTAQETTLKIAASKEPINPLVFRLWENMLSSNIDSYHRLRSLRQLSTGL